MKHDDDDPVLWKDLRKVTLRVKALEQTTGEIYEAIAAGDEAQAQFWNEHEELLQRQRRQLNRLKKSLE